MSTEPQAIARSAEDRRRLPEMSDEEHARLREEGRIALAEWEADHGEITDAERAAFDSRWEAVTGSPWPG